ncbi:MAG: hypothetical protein CNCCGFBP_02336 [Fimbriimonadaceae bacterium]|nr:hypothetical protein [Fimbriimonadaceae bacterium]
MFAVAPTDTTNPAMRLETSISRTEVIVTGNVALELSVPNAVAIAGAIFFRNVPTGYLPKNLTSSMRTMKWVVNPITTHSANSPSDSSRSPKS